MQEIYFRAATPVVITESLAESVVNHLETIAGKRVLIIVDRNVAKHPNVSDLNEQLAKKWEVLMYPVDACEPDTDTVDFHVDQLVQNKPDIIIGVGGGSCLDLAKAVSVLLCNPGPAANYQGWGLIKRPGIYKIMIPTTAGTGSEVTPGAVVINHATKRKGAIGSPFIFPDCSFLDASLTLTLPLGLTVTSGMDALSHAVESYSGKKENPIAKACARESFRLLANALPKVFSDPGNMHLRRNILVGSTLAGYAIYNLDTGAAHSLSYALGTELGVPHSLAIAMLLPKVMQHNFMKGIIIPYSELYDCAFHDSNNCTDADKAVKLVDFISSLPPAGSLPLNLSQFHKQDITLVYLAEKCLMLKTALANNPVDFGNDDAMRILHSLGFVK